MPGCSLDWLRSRRHQPVPRLRGVNIYGFAITVRNPTLQEVTQAGFFAAN